MVTQLPDSSTVAEERATLLTHADLAGPAVAAALADQADSWFRQLAAGLPKSWALMATGGYARGSLCPGSDIDVVLLHPKNAPAAEVRSRAEAFWYPIWDAGLKLSPSVHTPKSLLGLAADDLVTATSLLTVRCLAGDASAVDTVRAGALDQWRARPLRWLARLRNATEARWARFGEVSSLLEPDLKDGRGGVRDLDVFGWALATGLTGVVSVLDGALDALAEPARVLVTARCELHRVTSRPANVLLLQDQDAVAERMGLADAEALMREISSAARAIDWIGDRFWHRVDRGVSGLDRVRRTRPLPEPIPGATLCEDELDVTADADLADQSLVFRVAAAAARLGVPLSRGALATMAAATPPAVGPWTDRTRQAFVSLLGAGDAVVSTIEALEHVELFSRFLPEWRHVRSLPQRNAFHTYNVDRHLLVTVANAARHVRSVARPDLLLVAALLHDIGKGLSGDHTEAGMKLVADIVPRMGFASEDVDTIKSMVEHHLLLAETATRRDLSDPRTAANVAAAVGHPARLELLRMLTEADSLATGPSAWSSWKQSLVDALTAAVAAVFRGQPATTDAVDVEARFASLLEQVRGGRDGVCVQHEHLGEVECYRIAAADRPGLFATVAGTLALHGFDVMSAEAWTTADGIAVEQFETVTSQNGSTWSGPPRSKQPTSGGFDRVEQDLLDAIAGRLDVDARIDARIRGTTRVYKRAVAAAAPKVEVIVSNEASDSTTMIDVRVPDAPAVLYRLSSTLAAHSMNIRSAKVATLGHEVVDVFYVQRGDRQPGQLTAQELSEVRVLLRDVVVAF